MAAEADKLKADMAKTDMAKCDNKDEDEFHDLLDDDKYDEDAQVNNSCFCGETGCFPDVAEINVN